jgi:ankyrin repeat protein
MAALHARITRSFRTSCLVLAGVVALLFGATAQAAPQGRELAERVKAQDWNAARALVKQGADVNASLADGATPLHWAAHWDEREIASLLIQAGAKPNAADSNGVTPLLLACANGSVSMANLLIRAGADASVARATGVTPLMTAARTGNSGIVQLLLERGVNVNAAEATHNQTALMWAVAEGHTAIVRLLLGKGADVQARTPARQSRVAVSGQFAGGECCLPNYVGGFTPLLFAVQQGQVEAARLLLEAGANVNDSAADGSSALVLAIDSAPVVSDRVSRAALAAHTSQEAMARFLIERNADVNLHGAGRTALHSAVQRKMPDIVQLLLANGANPNARLERRLPAVSRDVGLQNGLDVNPIGATPFWLAASFGDASTMRALLEAGADPTLTSADRTTALMVAAGTDFVDGEDKYGVRTFDEDITPLARRASEAVQICLDRRLGVNLSNEKGQTALFGAVYMGSPLLVQLLVDHGAKIDVRNSKGQTPWSVAALGEYRAGSFFVKKETADLLEKLGADKTLGAEAARDRR